MDQLSQRMEPLIMRRRALYKLALYCAAGVAALGAYASNEQLAARTYAQSSIYSVLPTGSMEPTFDEDWPLLVQTPSFFSLKVGDVIIYRAARPYDYEGTPISLVCHRIVRRSSGGAALIAKGDHNDRPDDNLITESMYVGLVVGMIRRPDDAPTVAPEPVSRYLVTQ